MLILAPTRVTFAGRAWRGVKSIAISRKAAREIVEWSDGGPFATFADVPAQRVDVRVIADAQSDDLESPRLGASDVLVFVSGPTSGDGKKKRIEVRCVVIGVTTKPTSAGGGERTIDLVGISENGALDPVTVNELAEG